MVTLLIEDTSMAKQMKALCVNYYVKGKAYVIQIISIVFTCVIKVYFNGTLRIVDRD
jgi:hypothetical protein